MAITPELRLQQIRANDFNEVSRFIGSIHPSQYSQFNGYKINRKHADKLGLSIDHSFLLLHDRSTNKLVPYLFLPGKDADYGNAFKVKGTELGKGAFGRVKKVMSENGEVHALKIQLPKNRFEVNLYQREVNFLKKAGFSKAELARSQSSPKYYTIMDLAKGERLQKTRTKSIEQSLIIAQKICEQLADIHAKGIIHRDLKGDNIIYDQKENKVAIIDFGLATDSHQIPGFTGGTPGYMPPELNKTSFKCIARPNQDIYSLGQVLIKDLKLHESGNPEVIKLLQDMTATNPNHRIQDVHQVQLRLNNIINPKVQLAAPHASQRAETRRMYQPVHRDQQQHHQAVAPRQQPVSPRQQQVTPQQPPVTPRKHPVTPRKYPVTPPQQKNIAKPNFEALHNIPGVKIYKAKKKINSLKPIPVDKTAVLNKNKLLIESTLNEFSQASLSKMKLIIKQQNSIINTPHQSESKKIVAKEILSKISQSVNNNNYLNDSEKTDLSSLINPKPGFKPLAGPPKFR